MGASADYKPTANSTLEARFRLPYNYTVTVAIENANRGTVSVSPTAHSSYTYVWSATYYGDCDRWYLWPNGASAQLSVYLNPSDGGGQFSLTCKVYDGSTLVATVNGAAYVTPVSK